MIQAFHKQIQWTKINFYYNSLIISVIMFSIAFLVTILTSKKAEESGESGEPK